MTRQDDASIGSTVVTDDGLVLNRGLGVSAIVFMVVAAVAPLGAVSVVVPTVFGVGGNASAAVYFIVAAVVLGLFAVGFGLMSRYVKNAGAFYSYVQAGLGKEAGAGAASLALVSYMVLLISLCAYLGVAASSAVETFIGPTIDWWVLAGVALGVIAVLGSRDIEVSAKVLGVVLVLEVSVILVVNVVVVVRGGRDGLTAAPFDPSDALNGAPGLGLMFAFFAFVGFESTAVFRSEAADPDRTVPRATYIAVAFIGVLYAFTAWAQAIGIGTDRIATEASTDPAGIFFTLASDFVGGWMSDLVKILLVTSIFACALSFHNVVTRYQFNLARAGLLPRALGVIDPRRLTPSRSSLVVSVVSVGILAVLALSGLDPVTEIYTWLSGSATLGIIALMFVTSISVIVFHQRRGGDDSLWQSVIAPALAMIGLGAVLYMVIDNFPLLVGGNAAAIAVLAATIASALLGVVTAVAIRARDRERYDRLLD